MKKSNLKIIREENSIIIKKKADVVDYSIHAVIFIACIIFLFILEGAWDEPIFWVVYIACLFTNIASFLFLFLGKIVLDTDKKKISIYNLCRETYRFEEVKEVKSFFEEGDSEGGSDTHKLIILFHNNYKIEFHATSKTQAEELVVLLQSILFANDSC